MCDINKTKLFGLRRKENSRNCIGSWHNVVVANHKTHYTHSWLRLRSKDVWRGQKTDWRDEERGGRRERERGEAEGISHENSENIQIHRQKNLRMSLSAEYLVVKSLYRRHALVTYYILMYSDVRDRGRQAEYPDPDISPELRVLTVIHQWVNCLDNCPLCNLLSVIIPSHSLRVITT